MKKFFLGAMMVLFLLWVIARIVLMVQFDRNCGGYLKRAADANTIQLAKTQLRIAIDYLEVNNINSGYTSIIYRTPDEDIKFWHNNIVDSLKELEEISEDASPLEKSNVLMKLRETLMDHADNGSEEITVPAGISVYPYNTLMCLWGSLSAIFLAIGVIAKVYKD